MSVASVALAVGGVALLRGRRAFPVRVHGDSMSPTLRPGDLLAVTPLAPGEPRRGALVLVRDPVSGLEVVKRVLRLPGEDGLRDGEYWLLGDNPAASTDSRTRGAIARDRIVGVVRACYWPPRRMNVFRPRE